MSEHPFPPTDCEHCEQELDAVLLGIADDATTHAVNLHLHGCPRCQRRAATVQASLNELLHVKPIPMSPEARSALLQKASQIPLEGNADQIGLPQANSIPPLDSSPHQVPHPVRKRTSGRLVRTRGGAWLVTGVGLAAVLGVLVASPGAGPDVRQADVVISAGSSVVMARSDASAYPLVIRTSAGRLQGVRLSQARPAWYTEGVYTGGKAYLLDAANERLVVLNVAQGRVERTYPTPGGAAGLAVSGKDIFVKAAASGELRHFNGDATTVIQVAAPAQMPQTEEMDAVLMQPGRLLTTQHTSGQVVVLSTTGHQILARYQVGGAPVGLQSWKRQVLVLDVEGRLLELASDGRVTRTLRLPGHPDKFSVMGDFAYLTDRGGQVSKVDLVSFVLTQHRTFGKPMDIVALPDGHLALADATQGLVMLTSELSEL